MLLILFLLPLAVAETEKGIDVQIINNLGSHKEVGLSYGNFRIHKNFHLSIEKVGNILKQFLQSKME